MAKVKGFSLRVQWLGERLKKARLEAGYTLDEAGEYVELTGASISRFEKGTLRIKRPYLKELIDFYSVSNRREREAIMQLNEDAWRKDLWEGDTEDLEMGFLDHTWLEARAERICVFEPLVVHGLLQTSAYAEAIASYDLGAEASPEAVAQSVELRTKRQRILAGENPTRMSVVLEEPALLRPVGGKKVFADQLSHLLALGRETHMEIRVLPRSAEWDPGYAGPFTYFEMPDPFSHVALTEGLAGRVFLEDEAKVERFRSTYDNLVRLSHSPSKTATYIQTTLKEFN